MGKPSCNIKGERNQALASPDSSVMRKIGKREPEGNVHVHQPPYNLSSITNQNYLADLDSDSDDDGEKSMDSSVSSWISNTGKHLFRRSLRVSGNDSSSSSLLDGFCAFHLSGNSAEEPGTRSVSKRLSGSISGLGNNSSSSLLNGSYSKLGKSPNGSGTLSTEDLSEFSFEDEMFNQNSFASLANQSNNSSFNKSLQKRRPEIQIEKFEQLFEEEEDEDHHEDSKQQPPQPHSDETRKIFEGRVRQNVEDTLKKIQKSNVSGETDTKPDTTTARTSRRRRRSVDAPMRRSSQTLSGRKPERTSSHRRRSVDAPMMRSTNLVATTAAIQEKPVRQRRRSACKSLERSCLKASIATPSRSMPRLRRDSQQAGEGSERDASNNRRSSLLAEGRKEFARRANLSGTCRRSSSARRRTPAQTQSTSSERPRLRRASSPSIRGLSTGPNHRVKRQTNGRLPPKQRSR